MQIALHHNRRFLSFKMNRSGRFEMEPNPSIFASTIFLYLPRLITKIQEKMSELDGIHIKINDVYSCGAVDGYTEEHLVFC